MNKLGLFAVNPVELPFVDYWDGRHGLPQKPGIYFVVRRDGVVVYVGQALSVRQRWTGVHHASARISKQSGEHRIHYLECEVSELNDYEAYFIHKFTPPLNVVYPKISDIHKLIEMAETGAISYKEAFESLALKSMNFANRVDRHMKTMAQMNAEKDALQAEILEDLFNALSISSEFHKASTRFYRSKYLSQIHSHN